MKRVEPAGGRADCGEAELGVQRRWIETCTFLAWDALFALYYQSDETARFVRRYLDAWRACLDARPAPAPYYAAGELAARVAAFAARHGLHASLGVRPAGAHPGGPGESFNPFMWAAAFLWGELLAHYLPGPAFFALLAADARGTLDEAFAVLAPRPARAALLLPAPGAAARTLDVTLVASTLLVRGLRDHAAGTLAEPRFRGTADFLLCFGRALAALRDRFAAFAASLAPDAPGVQLRQLALPGHVALGDARLQAALNVRLPPRPPFSDAAGSYLFFQFEGGAAAARAEAARRVLEAALAWLAQEGRLRLAGALGLMRETDDDAEGGAPARYTYARVALPAYLDMETAFDFVARRTLD